jgi:hypothetical protein
VNEVKWDYCVVSVYNVQSMVVGNDLFFLGARQELLKTIQICLISTYSIRETR